MSLLGEHTVYLDVAYVGRERVEYVLGMRATVDVVAVPGVGTSVEDLHVEGLLVRRYTDDDETTVSLADFARWYARAHGVEVGHHRTLADAVWQRIEPDLLNAAYHEIEIRERQEVA